MNRPVVVVLALALVAVPVLSGLSAGGVGVVEPGGTGAAASPTGSVAGADDAGTADATADEDGGEGEATASDDAGTGGGIAGARRVAANETPNRLEIGSDTAVSGYASPSPDLGATLTAGDGELRAVYVAYLARERLAAADTDAERTAAVRTVLNRSERLTERLRDREAAAVRAYHEGTITVEELVRRLATVHAEASALRTALLDLRERAPGVFNNQALANRRLSLQLDLDGFTTPVRERAVRSLRGDAADLHVAATSNGVVLELVEGETYFREAVRMDNYAPNESREYGLTATERRLGELYPWTFAGVPTSLDSIGERLFLITKSHSQGQMRLYFDRSTGEVYREFQQLRLSRVPTTAVATAESESAGVRVVVNRTAGANPTRVAVTTTAGDPVNATVRVGNRTLGTTGEDGVLWTLAPRGSFDLAVAGPSGTVNVSVDA